VADRGVYSISNGRSALFSYQGAKTRLFNVDNELYLTVDGLGIMRWNGNEFRKLLMQSQLGDDSVILLGHEKGKLHILTSKLALYSTSASDYLTSTDTILHHEVTFTSQDRITFRTS